jgi:hypothetical protein
MSDSFRGQGMAGNAGEYDGYSERGAPSEFDEQDDFFSGPADEFGGQAGFRREEENTSPAPSGPSGPILDHSHLRPGKQAALLSHERTLELYRANAKKVGT